MENKESLQDILNQVKEVDNGINSMIIPILKDTIKDGNRHNNRLFIFAMAELVVLLVTVIISIFLIYRQNIKYQEFLNQFEFGMEEYSYSQDLDTHEGGDIVEPSINVNK